MSGKERKRLVLMAEVKKGADECGGGWAGDGSVVSAGENPWEESVDGEDYWGVSR